MLWVGSNPWNISNTIEHIKFIIDSKQKYNDDSVHHKIGLLRYRKTKAKHGEIDKLSTSYSASL